jgi:ABC-type phosphate/phosphonate transport system ATPase subunit
MVLEAVDLDITKGMFIGVIASEQKTETFLMRILGQQLHSDFGLILLGGSQLNRIRVDERIALKHKYVVIHPFYPAPLETSVLDHVLDRHPIQSMLFGRKVHRVELASYHMQALGLTHLFDRPVNQLGSDERMLVSVVKALMREPSLVMLDTIWFKLKDEAWLRLLNHLKNLVVREGLSVMVNRVDEMTQAYLQRILAFERGRLVLDNVSEKVDWHHIHQIKIKRSLNASDVLQSANIVSVYPL